MIGYDKDIKQFFDVNGVQLKIKDTVIACGMYGFRIGTVDRIEPVYATTPEGEKEVIVYFEHGGMGNFSVNRTKNCIRVINKQEKWLFKK